MTEPRDLKPLDSSPLLVLVTGPGRSGTSAMAGSLHHLGLHVPGPFLGANESNPKGFFESRWAVRFHKRLARAARIHDFDSRPNAWGRVRDAVTARDRADLIAFLRTRSEGQRCVVVKDPRTAWVQGLWREAAAEVGLDIRYLSMLRHPAEVVGSRTTYYAAEGDEAARRSYETFNVARWINGSLVSERETRGSVRSFVHYPDLLADWRPVVARVADELGLPVHVAEGPHPLDDFLEPSLRRHAVTWDDLEVPAELQSIADDVWAHLCTLERSRGHDPAASRDLDVCAERYARLFQDSAAIAHDAMEEAMTQARSSGYEEGLHQGAESPRAGVALEEATARQLARALAARVRHRRKR